MKNLPMNFYPNLTEKFLVNSYIINKGISIKTQKYIAKQAIVAGFGSCYYFFVN